MTNRAQIVTGLLFDAYVGIHQVRILVFDDYQKYTLPLSINYMTMSYYWTIYIYIYLEKTYESSNLHYTKNSLVL